ncbi:DNA/RNA nuclease SfsA [Aquifex aeolicus]|uniref:Sugar fermentation stimulation protein homolog n=1 Tax=Aquifex aeolicus (strain VF5) TaxID=224324 RepID=SFSA_AQUAE|nr:DNA/RNA nuclease SfsA [Aquifex aeolicus]O66469.1 RecName: Full=Sugar fermentation stimulation protein homolog [Aquifex aeolicus VF5]AAC06428.1 sugar fermentation stimulation protein [Aquifex aeolicus VF5]
MKLPPLMPAIFVKRLNRFVGKVFLNGKIERALIRNTGRLSELLKFGNTVFVREKEGGKYRYEIILARAEKSLVCVESHYANKIFEEYIRRNWKFKELKREVKLENERFDFLIDNTLVEVKSVNLVKNGVAMFPDAPTKRGTGHIRTLIKLSDKFKPLLVFVVQRSDFLSFEPNCETDPEFCKAYYEYVSKGFEVLVLKCRVSLEEINVVEVFFT